MQSVPELRRKATVTRRGLVRAARAGSIPYTIAASELCASAIGSFGHNVDYGAIVGACVEELAGRGRYRPPKVTLIETDEKVGFPNLDLVSNSLIERQNLTIRMQRRRLTN